MVYAQFQEFLMLKAIRRIVVPGTYYPNEGKIELRQRALSFLSSLGTGPVSEHLDSVSIHHQSLYGWWGSALKNLVYALKNGKVQLDELRLLIDMFDDIDERDRYLFCFFQDVSCMFRHSLRYMQYLFYVFPAFLKHHHVLCDDIMRKKKRGVNFTKMAAVFENG